MYRRFGIITATLVLALALPLAAAAAQQAPRNFVAPLSGDQEVEPVDTNATGVAHFQLSRNGDGLSFRLNVANIAAPTMAHIHLEDPSGPVVAWLHPAGPPPDPDPPARFNGTLATGTLTGADLVGPLAGEALADLVDEILAGNAFVNVHTAAHPGGEIAGQISRPRGHIGR